MADQDVAFRVRMNSTMLEMYKIICKEHTSTISSMTRKLIEDMVETNVREMLQEIGSIYISSAELGQVLPEIYEALLQKLIEWTADEANTASQEDVDAFKAGEYTIEILFGDDFEVSYTAGRDMQGIANQPPWVTDSWHDFWDTSSKEWILGVMNRYIIYL
jgi:hypothetical protein